MRTFFTSSFKNVARCFLTAALELIFCCIYFNFTFLVVNPSCEGKGTELSVRDLPEITFKAILGRVAPKAMDRTPPSFFSGGQSGAIKYRRLAEDTISFSISVTKINEFSSNVTLACCLLKAVH